MAHLNHYSKIYKHIPLGICLMFNWLNAGGVIPMFNPIDTNYKNYRFSVQGFIADDPVTLHDFFNDWDGRYTPASTNNYALEFLRVDIGKNFENGYYLGYFYQRDVLIKTNRGFVDGYYIVKNNLTSNQIKEYDLKLDIYGIIRHGLMFGRQLDLYVNSSQKLSLGVSAFISYDTDIQYGSLKGKGSIYPDGTYDASATTSYYYMDNLLYDLDVRGTYGLGYGINLALKFEDTQYGYSISICANDLLSYTHWKDLPYSLVYIQTQNQEFNNGYVSYNPTIAGWELYKDFTQKIEPKYNFEISKEFFQDYSLSAGFDYMYDIYFPYIKANIAFDDMKLGCQYESKYNTFGIEYIDRYIHAKIYTDGIKNASAVGFLLDIHYSF